MKRKHYWSRFQKAPWPERFWDKVEKTDTCWNWTASVDTSGYPQISINGKLRRATRVSLELAGVEIPGKMLICHRCDNPRCVRPDHLFFGTHNDNIADMVAKGRSAKGDNSTSRLYPELRQRGEQHPKAKLTEAQVREIRHRNAAGESQRKLAAAFGVGKNAIQGILEGKTWRNVV